MVKISTSCQACFGWTRLMLLWWAMLAVNSEQFISSLWIKNVLVWWIAWLFVGWKFSMSRQDKGCSMIHCMFASNKSDLLTTSLPCHLDKTLFWSFNCQKHNSSWRRFWVCNYWTVMHFIWPEFNWHTCEEWLIYCFKHVLYWENCWQWWYRWCIWMQVICVGYAICLQYTTEPKSRLTLVGYEKALI